MNRKAGVKPTVETECFLPFRSAFARFGKTNNVMTSLRKAFFAFVILLLSPIAANAITILDQSTGLTLNGNSAVAIIASQSIAQTLTVGAGGLLSQIDVQVAQSPETVGDVTLSILDASGGIPGASLGTTLISLAEIPLISTPDSWTSVDVSSLGLSFNVGDMIAIELSR